MKIVLEKSYRVYEVYGTMDINPDDYPQLNGLTEDEIVEYINEHKYEFNTYEGHEDNIVDEFVFNVELIKDKHLDEEYTISQIK